jgi:hypothetical protein
MTERKKCRTEHLITAFLQEEACVVKFTYRTVRNNIIYHNRVWAANSAPNILRHFYDLANALDSNVVFSQTGISTVYMDFHLILTVTFF